MTRIAVLMASALLNASTIPSVASECTSSTDIAASRARGDGTQPARQYRRQRMTCCTYAASFYESVTLRQAAATCIRDVNHERNLAALDSEINAFNNLLAAKCGS